jgi:RNA polymerase sigma factor (sigma-70 family)
MATRPPPTVLQGLRQAALRHDGAGLTDGELLECFLARRDEDAFAALVRRHGPIVLGVCRRVLGNEADAEDAFQATFLVLARKAESIRPRGLVGNWLYGVAHNTARKARAMIRRRRAKERQAAALPRPAPPEGPDRDCQAVVDREVRALPDKYRAPIVLCDLEGQTLQEAARQLGWPLGTVGTRRARGRALLARRLSRRGLVLPAGALAAVLAPDPAAAAVPAALVLRSAHAASQLAAGQAVPPGLVSAAVAALTQGVLRTMLLNKLRTPTAVVLLTALTCCGAAVLIHRTKATGQAEPVREARPDAAEPPPAAPAGSARAVIERAVQAHGGAAKVARWRTVRLRLDARIVAPSLKDPFTLLETWRRPDDYRAETTTQGPGGKTTTVGVLRKGKGWLQFPRGMADLEGDDAAVLRDSRCSLGLALLASLNDPGRELASVGEAPVAGKVAVGVLARSAAGPDLTLYFDKDTGLLLSEIHSVRMPGDARATRQQVYFSDYEEKDGVKYPRHVVVYDDGSVRYCATVTEIEFPDKVDDKLFAKP